MKTTNNNTHNKQTKQQKQEVSFTDISNNWQQPKKTKLTFIDVFSGCGGITQGFKLAGLEPIAGLDFNKEAV